VTPTSAPSGHHAGGVVVEPAAALALEGPVDVIVPSKEHVAKVLNLLKLAQPPVGPLTVSLTAQPNVAFRTPQWVSESVRRGSLGPKDAKIDPLPPSCTPSPSKPAKRPRLDASSPTLPTSVGGGSSSAGGSFDTTGASSFEGGGWGRSDSSSLEGGGSYAGPSLQLSLDEDFAEVDFRF
jgi:hypothetical protein